LGALFFKLAGVISLAPLFYVMFQIQLLILSKTFEEKNMDTQKTSFSQEVLTLDKKENEQMFGVSCGIFH
jgi:hypothetical protein